MADQPPQNLPAAHDQSRTAPNWREIAEIFLIFLRLGATAFGGPVAHIAVMQSEFVQRRKWLSKEKFLDLIGATNLIPGPNSTEVSIHLGFLRAGWPGLIASGMGFILPSMLAVLLIAWVYQQYGTTPELTWILYGIKPVIVIIILQALVSLGKISLKKGHHLAVFIIGFAAALAGVNDLVILFGCGLLVAVFEKVDFHPASAPAILLFPMASSWIIPLNAAPFSLLTLFLTFLKIGSVLYGSGYVLFAFIQSNFVENLGWISSQMLIDAIAVGQITPGPVSTSATFIGYQLAGLPGALIATAGIFIPAFFFVAISAPIIKLARKSSWFGAILDGVNTSSLSLMSAVTVQIARAAFTDWVAVGIAAGTALLLWRTKINPTWLIVAAGGIGLLWQLAEHTIF
ncbi:MAG TPA: chromate efflux transporter [Bellilinea sp.]|nr:chromate efflux transporter [Bellilinea sp.]